MKIIKPNLVASLFGITFVLISNGPLLSGRGLCTDLKSNTERGASVGPFQLQVQTTNTNFHAGGEVPILVSLHNTGSNAVSFYFSSRTCRLKVLGPDHKEAKSLPLMKNLLTQQINSVEWIQPKQSFTHIIPAHLLFEMTNAGIYEVSAFWQVPSDTIGNFTNLSSGTIKVLVEPTPP